MVDLVHAADASKKANTHNNKQVNREHPFILPNNGQQLVPT